MQLCLEDSTWFNSDDLLGNTPSGTTCEPIRFCSRYSYSCSVCIDNENSATCVCNPGFRRNGTECININECKEENINCSLNEECIDKEGYYLCSCVEGYTSNGTSCYNIDECATDLHSCSIDARCIDTEGSYKCVCDPGFSGNGMICQNICGDFEIGMLCDFLECRELNYCFNNSHCVETRNDFGSTATCECDSGYKYRSICVDGSSGNEDSEECDEECVRIYACKNGEHNCSEHATCTDSGCVCNSGFVGTGVACNNINECELHYSSVLECPSNSGCIDTFGSYQCACHA